MLRALILIAALVPTALGAALPPCASDQWMRRATDVVQVEVTRVEVPTGIGQPNSTVNCPVSGVVRRAFRGVVQVGETITFGVLCYTDAVGGGRITNPEALRKASFLEVHMMNGQPVHNGPSVLILDALTDQIAWQPECD